MDENLKKIYKLFYRGFVELDSNKNAIEKYGKGHKLKEFEEIKNISSYGGVLLPDTAFIDFDSKEESDVAYKLVCALNLNCRVTRTDRGRHFTFLNDDVMPIKKCCQHKYTVLGLEADCKVGTSNSYEILKLGGNERFVEREIDLSRPVARVPSFLHFTDYTPSFPFNKLTEGAGRNQTLFNYILVLQREGFTDDEIKEAIKLINDFVLPDKLPDNELKQVIRDDAFKGEVFSDGKRFLHEKFGDYLIRNYNIKRINGFLHVYHDGFYEANNRLIEHIMLRHIRSITNNKRQEVYKYMYAECFDDIQEAPANLIAFKNVVYDVSNDKTYDLSPSYIITNQIPHNYNPNAKSESIDNMLDSVSNNNKKIRNLIEEMIGFCFYRRSEHGKCFILKGKASNGKSTLLTTLRFLLGETNTASLDITELDDRFSTIMLQGKLANIGDDISDEYIANTAIFKKIVTGNKISAEQKGVEKTQFSPYCKLIFSANNIPRIGRGKDNAAIVRRLKVVPLTATFSETDANFKPFIVDELLTEESMEYLILLAIEGLKRWINNKGFTECEEATEALSEFEETNNPILGFFKELEEDGLENSLLDHTAEEIHIRYSEYCNKNGHVALGQSWCTKQIKDHFKEYDTVRKSFRYKDDMGRFGKTTMFVKKDVLKLENEKLSSSVAEPESNGVDN